MAYHCKYKVQSDALVAHTIGFHGIMILMILKIYARSSTSKNIRSDYLETNDTKMKN